MRTLLLLFAGAACGRISFGDASRDTPEPDAHIPDTGRPASACPLADTAPDPITTAGTTLRYDGFDNSFTPLASVTASALDETGSELVTAVSNASGQYMLAVPTGGVPRHVRFRYSAAGHYTSYAYLDQPLDRPLTGSGVPLWAPGDAPLWTQAMMTSLYDELGMTQDFSRTVINAAVRRCDGSAIPGATVTFDPPPDAVIYTTLTGFATSATELPNTNAVAFNAPAGTTRITATAPGLSFPTLTLDITAAAGDLNHLVLLRPYE